MLHVCSLGSSDHHFPAQNSYILIVLHKIWIWASRRQSPDCLIACPCTTNVVHMYAFNLSHVNVGLWMLVGEWRIVRLSRRGWKKPSYLEGKSEARYFSWWLTFNEGVSAAPFLALLCILLLARSPFWCTIDFWYTISPLYFSLYVHF